MEQPVHRLASQSRLDRHRPYRLRLPPSSRCGRAWGFNRELDEASRDLGASEWQTFRHVILPYMQPGLIAGALLAFTLSLDDFVITFFTSGPETVTFPVKVYSLVRRGVARHRRLDGADRHHPRCHRARHAPAAFGKELTPHA